MISNSKILNLIIQKNFRNRFFGFKLFANFQILSKFHIINDVMFQIEEPTKIYYQNKIKLLNLNVFLYL